MDEWQLEPAHDLGLSFRERLRSLRRESGLLEAATHLIWWELIRDYLGIYHRLEVHGREHLPAKLPFILVANHASHLDALALAASLPPRLRDHIFAIAARDAFFETTPAAAFATLTVNALPLWRKNSDPRDVQALRSRLLEEPCGFVLFPEGTRSRDGRMGLFRRGIGMLVAETAVPVVPCYLEGAFAALPPHRKVPLPKKLVLTLGPPLVFASVKNDGAGWSRVAAETEAAVRQLGGTGPREGGRER